MRFPRAAAHAAAGIVLFSVISASSAGAHIVSDREAKVLAALPDSLARQTLAEDAPDASGFCGVNRTPGTFRASAQVPALRVLGEATARRDSATAEKCWLAIQQALVMQRPGGRFELLADGAPQDTVLAWEDAVVWLGALNRTVAIVMNGPLAEQFRFRWALLRPKLERSMNGLVAMAPLLEQRAKKDPARLLELSEALLLADGHYHVTEYGLAGQRALAAALPMQKSDGSFAAKSAAKLAYETRCLSALEGMNLYFPGPFLDRAGNRLTPVIEKALSGKSGADAATRRLARRTLAIHSGRIALGPAPSSVIHSEPGAASR
jgi:hypothetical protein